MSRLAPTSTRALRRPLVQDSLLAVALAVLSVISLWTPPAVIEYDFRDPDLLGVALALLGSGAVALRSRYPVVALGAALSGVVPLVQLGYSQNLAGLAALLTLYSVAVRRSFRVSLTCGLGTMSAIGTVLVTGPLEAAPTDWIANALVITTGWSFGRSVRNRRARMASLEARDQALASAEAAELRTALIEKRSQAAQELQDLVAHSLTEITVQMGAARRMIGTDPEMAALVLLDGEAAGRAASQEMRRLFRIMAEQDAGPELRPMPDLDALPELADAERAAGMDVAVENIGEPRAVSAGLSLTAYRIIEEALMNARRHASAGQVTVSLDWGAAELTVTVVDDGGRTGIPWSSDREAVTGGLRRLQRRATVYGGELRWGRRSGRGFAVVARLPLHEQVTA